VPFWERGEEFENSAEKGTDVDSDMERDIGIPGKI